jgi:hypothetical protein
LKDKKEAILILGLHSENVITKHEFTKEIDEVLPQVKLVLQIKASCITTEHSCANFVLLHSQPLYASKLYCISK